MSNPPTLRALPSVKHLPYPLAWAWNEVLVTAEGSPERQAALLACLLVTLRTLVSLQLADYARGPRDPNLDKQLKQCLDKPSNGHWLQLWISLTKHLEARGKKDPASPPFLREAYGWYHGENGDVGDSLKRLLEIRNSASHFSHAPSPPKLQEDVSALFERMERVLGSLSWMADYSLVRVCDDMRLMSHGAVQGRIQLFRGEKLKTIPEPCTWQGVLGVDELYLLSHKRSEALLLSPWARLGRLDLAEDIFILEKAPNWKKLVCQAVSSPQDFNFQEKHFVLASKDRPSFETWWTHGNFTIYLQKLSFLSQPPSYVGRSDVASQRWVPVEVASVPAPPPQPAPPQPAPARQNPPKRSFLGRAFLWVSGVAALSTLGCAACLGSWAVDAGSAGVGVLERALGAKRARDEEFIRPTEPYGGSPSKPLVKPKKLGKPLTNSVGMTFQGVSPGSFKWASKTGRSARVEITRPFLIQTTEVTVGQWVEIMGADPSMARGCGDACPVELVSWYDAALYANKLSEREELAPCYKLTRCKPEAYASLGCSRAYDDKDQGGWCGKGARGRDNSAYNYGCEQVLWAGPTCEGYRLPTEAEWEYAARAGETGPYYAPLDKIAWGGDPNAEKDCPNGAKHPVARKQPNALGLYDVLGNVAEWVWDVYSERSEASQEDPSGPGGDGARTFRGGSECQSFEEDLRLDARRSSNPINRSRAVGFRLARSWDR